jgi:superfamily II DNA/RNA helicase
VHFDPPAEAKDYTHRSGRTARAGADGVVVTMVTPEVAKDVSALQKALGQRPVTVAPDLATLPPAPPRAAATPAPRSAAPHGASDQQRRRKPKRPTSPGQGRPHQGYGGQAKAAPGGASPYRSSASRGQRPSGR